jgi:hypothetical protein
LGAICGDSGGGIEGEREALQVGVGWGRCCCGEFEFVGGIEDTKICGTNPGLRIETWGTQILGGGEVGLGGGPGGLEETGGVGMDLAAGGDSGRGEEVQLLTGAGAGDIEEALAFGGLAGVMDTVEPVVEGLRRLATTGDGSEHEVSRSVGGRVGWLQFGPGEQAGAVGGWLAFEGRDEDDIPLQSLGLVDGEEFDEGGSIWDGIGFGVELLQAALEEGWIKQVGGAIFFQFKLQFIQ